MNHLHLASRLINGLLVGSTSTTWNMLLLELSGLTSSLQVLAYLFALGVRVAST
jgi:hypothetical protein